MLRSNILIVAAHGCLSNSSDVKDDPLANIDQDEDGYTPNTGCNDGEAAVFQEHLSCVMNSTMIVMAMLMRTQRMGRPIIRFRWDGYGVDEGAVNSCVPIDGSAELNGDCDAEPAPNPGAAIFPTTVSTKIAMVKTWTLLSLMMYTRRVDCL